MPKEHCPTCGSEVTIGGEVTRYFVPVKHSEESKKRAINFYHFVQKHYVLYPGGYQLKDPHKSIQEPDKKFKLEEIYDIYLNSL